MVAVACTLAALDAGRDLEARIRSVERVHTFAGWVDSAAVEREVAADGAVLRLRTARLFRWGLASLGAASAVPLLIGLLRWRRRRLAEMEESAGERRRRKESEIRGFISLHLDTLAQKRAELRTVNAYGVVDDAAWQQELVYFINRVLRPGCSVDAEQFTFVDLRSMVERQISLLG